MLPGRVARERKSAGSLQEGLYEGGRSPGAGGDTLRICRAIAKPGPKGCKRAKRARTGASVSCAWSELPEDGRRVGSA